MSDTILKVSGVTKNFGGVRALDKVDLEIKKGEIHCLVGGNGSGKSTLIKIVSGFYRPDSGDVEFDGVKRARYSTGDAIEAGVQVIYQDMSVFPNLTVAENIALSVFKSRHRKLINWREVDRLARSAFEKIGVNLPLHELLEDLSVADKQIVAIARALLYDAKLLIMDEPTTTLTRKEIDKLFSIIRTLQSQGVSILFISHKLDEVFEIATRFTVLRNGQNVVTGDTADIDREKLAFYISGRKIEGERFRAGVQEGDTPLFEVKNLCLKNGFEDISFSVMPGEILGITGLLGSGRTELAMALFGLYPVTGGEIYIKGRRVDIKSPVAALKHKIAYVPEDRLTEGLFLLQSIEDNISVANIDNMRRKNGGVDKAGVHEGALRWQDNLSIKLGQLKDAIGTLSGGNQQKVVLAKWLLTEPDVLVLNGPTVGVDIAAKFDLHAHIRGIVEKRSTAVVVISDDILEVIQNCNRVLVVKKGRITDELNSEGLDESALISVITSDTAGRAGA
jgi:simple sugar transport system ATP-binding protein